MLQKILLIKAGQSDINIIIYCNIVFYSVLAWRSKSVIDFKAPIGCHMAFCSSGISCDITP